MEPTALGGHIVIGNQLLSMYIILNMPALACGKGGQVQDHVR